MQWLIIIGLFFSFSIIEVSLGFSTLPPYIVPCSRSDKNFNECALNNGRAAIPRIAEGDASFLIPSFEPFKINRLDFMNSKTFQLYLTDMEVSGFDVFKLEKINWDIEHKIINLTFFTPRMIGVGTYKIAGKLLIMSLQGSGLMNNSFYDCQVDVSINYSLNKRNNKEYMELTKVHSSSRLGKMHANFSNLMNNPQLSIEMNKFLNENWKAFAEELIPPFDRFLETLIISIVNPIVHKIPFDEIVKP